MGIVDFFVNSAPAVMFLPLWAFIMIFLNASIPFISSKRMTLNLSLSSTVLGIIFAICSLIYCVKNPQTILENNAVWLNTGNLQVVLGTMVDNLSSAVFLFSGLILFAVQLYSYGYFKEDKSFHRFYMYLNLLSFALFGLIFASNAVQTYIFLEISGVCVYLLLGFWYPKKSSTDMAKKAFIINKIGDICFLAGLLVMIYYSIIFLPAQNVALLSYDSLQNTAEMLLSMLSEPVFSGVVVLMLAGQFIKLAQYPFSDWLAEATDCPVPVNAVIQGAVFGVYFAMILGRFYPLFILSKIVMSFMVVIGILSAFGYAYVAMSQNNINKLLAYSTSSQLGLAFTAIGFGAFAPAVFYVLMHGIAKVLLILVCGTVIKVCDNESNIKYLGGVRKEHSGFAIGYLIGAIGVSGILAGVFFPQNIIFEYFVNEGATFIAVGFLIISFMSAFALFRAYFIIFEGDVKTKLAQVKSKSIYTSIFLGVLLVISGGFLLQGNFDKFIYFITPEKHSISLLLAVLVMFSVLGGIYSAFTLYGSVNSNFVVIKEKLLSKDNLIYKLSYNCLSLSTVQDWFIESIFMRFCRLLDFINKYIVNGFVVVISLTTRIFSYLVSRLQNGNIQSYLTYSVFLIMIILFAVMLVYFVGSLVGV